MSPEKPVITIVMIGNDVVRTVRSIFTQEGINWVNEVKLIKQGRLGNFKTLTHIVSVPDKDPQPRRRQITGAIAKESTHLLMLYPHGDPYTIYVFDRRAFLE